MLTEKLDYSFEEISHEIDGETEQSYRGAYWVKGVICFALFLKPGSIIARFSAVDNVLVVGARVGDCRSEVDSW